MNAEELTQLLNELIDEIHLGEKKRQEIVGIYSEYIVSKFRERILSVLNFK